MPTRSFSSFVQGQVLCAKASVKNNTEPAGHSYVSHTAECGSCIDSGAAYAALWLPVAKSVPPWYIFTGANSHTTRVSPLNDLPGIL